MPGRVMVVAYNFPPVAGAGIERTLKFVTYLPEFGWEPVVIAASHPAARLVDPGSLSRIPVGTEVHRAASFEPAHVRRLLRTIVAATRGRPSVGPESGTGNASADADVRGSGRQRLRDAANRHWGRLVSSLFFPDEQLLWVPFAIAAGFGAQRGGAVDVIYSSSSPVSSHLAAAALKTITGARWVADFRDPWIGNVFAQPLGRVHGALQRRLEGSIAGRADRLVFPTQLLRDEYATRYPARAHRFVVIPNGYDRTELHGESGSPELRPADGTFLLVYAGSIYGRRDLPLFLDGVELLLSRRPELRERLRVEFIGWFNEENAALARRRLPGVDPVVRHLGFRPRREAIARLRSAQAGLILIPAEPGRELFVGTKVYEYLGLDKQVLAVTPPGETQLMLEELDWGVVASPTPEGVAQGIEQLLEQPATGRTADPERRFERRNLTGRLAAVLDEVRAESA